MQAFTFYGPPLIEREESLLFEAMDRDEQDHPFSRPYDATVGFYKTWDPKVVFKVVRVYYPPVKSAKRSQDFKILACKLMVGTEIFLPSGPKPDKMRADAVVPLGLVWWGRKSHPVPEEIMSLNRVGLADRTCYRLGETTYPDRFSTKAQVCDHGIWWIRHGR